MNNQRLQAGVAEIEITPKVGMRLAAEFAERTAKSVENPLFAKALILSSGDVSLAIVTLDVFGLAEGAASKILFSIAERTGIPYERVMVFGSRTRGAPVTTGIVGCGAIDEEYIQTLADKSAEAALQAKHKLQPAALGVHSASLPHLAYNHRLITRNRKVITAWMGIPKDEVLGVEGPTDPAFTTLVVRDEHGFPIAIIWNFAADIRFVPGEAIDAGLPGLVQNEVDARLHKHVPLLYLPGCGGNCSFTWDLEESVDLVASAVMALQLETPCDPTLRLDSKSEKVILPIRDVSKFWAEADVTLKYPQGISALQAEIAAMQAEDARAIPAMLQVFRLGRIALVGMPGMPFTEIGLALKEKSCAPFTVVAANCGGDTGYMIPKEAFLHEGYETWEARSAKVGPGGAEFITEESAELIRELWK